MVNESKEPFSEFQFRVTKDLPELGERVLTFDLERGLSLGDDEYSFGKLIGEMDDKERELAIEKLLNENMKTRLLSEFVHRI